jgi:phage virion morphogenesis protein
MIKITIDDREIQKMLKDLAGRVKDRRPLMQKIAGIMQDAVDENFKQEGRPKWKPSKRAQKQGGKTLQDTGSLATSISSRHDNNSAQIGTNRGIREIAFS